ncbi:MAG: hypothetical protein Q8M16_07105 [Pirellulaceae bacterium]|nr:hypothetical protein [Pirellulaceae bacterium]
MRLCELFLILLTLFAIHDCRAQDSDVKEETTENQDTPTSVGPDETSKATSEDQKPSTTLDSPRLPVPNLEPHASRVRAVRAIRFGVLVLSVLLGMLTTVVLMQVNRWSHGRHAGRLWWLGVLLVPAWLLVGGAWAWNNDLWHAWLDGNFIL